MTEKIIWNVTHYISGFGPASLYCHVMHMINSALDIDQPTFSELSPGSLDVVHEINEIEGDLANQGD